jgi:hypothetical protein
LLQAGENFIKENLLVWKHETEQTCLALWCQWSANIAATAGYGVYNPFAFKQPQSLANSQVVRA